MYKKWSKTLQEHLQKTLTEEIVLEKMRQQIFSTQSQKKESAEPKRVSGVSFCISTNAGKIEKTLLEIKSIKDTMAYVDVPYEIIVAGVVEPFREDKSLILVDSTESAKNGFLGKIRNDAASESSCETIVFVDDDFIFPKTWARQFIDFSKSNSWSVLGNKILLPAGDRFWDRATMNPHTLVDYDYKDNNNNLYQTGGFWIMRRKTHMEHKWNESIPINGAERGLSPVNEDIELSIRMHRAGIELSFDKDNYVWNNDESYMEVFLGHSRVTVKKDIMTKKYGFEYFIPTSEEFKLSVERLKK